VPLPAETIGVECPYVESVPQSKWYFVPVLPPLGFTTPFSVAVVSRMFDAVCVVAVGGFSATNVMSSGVVGDVPFAFVAWAVK
jgi:hypothetical protein